MYEKYIKRFFDFVLSLFAIIILSPLLVFITILVKIKLGDPVIFKQQRPGRNEKIFTLYKFRTMLDAYDEKGKLLSDKLRMTSFGNQLRRSSLDELPELFNILKGDMSIVGPRPLLVRYLPYYKENERHRHNVRPGLTGLAQIKGRNFLNWEERFAMDCQYAHNVTITSDIKIILITIKKVLARNDIMSLDVDKAKLDFKNLDVERANLVNHEVIIKRLIIDDIYSQKETLVSLLQMVLNENHKMVSEADTFHYYENMLRFTKDETAIILGAFDKEMLCGFHWCYERNEFGERRLHSCFIAIEKEYQNQNIGSRFYQAMCETAKKMGIDTIEAMCTFKNLVTMEFHEKNGFEVERVKLIKKI